MVTWMKKPKERSPKKERLVIIANIVVILLVFAAAWYVNDYARADATALDMVYGEESESDVIEEKVLNSGDIAFIPADPVAGLIFYPGAKVEPEAYAPLMEQLADRGILCVIVSPLFKLPLFDADAANGVAEQFPEVDTWYIAGHSMGGVAAADYLSHHEGDFEGIVFLASYPSVDLSGYSGKVLSIVGSNDEVLNRQSYEDAQSKLPASTRELVIEGGNHAYYGDYGEQAGDGQATISRADQQAQTAAAIAELVSRAALI